MAAKSLHNRIQDGIAKRIEELKTAQYRRAFLIEDILTGYEPKLRPRSVSEYIALSTHQRTLMGVAAKVEATDVNVNINIIKKVVSVGTSGK